MDLHQCWRAKVEISPWCETKRTKMKASAPEEENRDRNCEGPCHLDKRQQWHWKHYLVEEEKAAQRATCASIHPPTPIFSQRVVDAFLFPLTHLFCAVSWWVLVKSEQKPVILLAMPLFIQKFRVVVVTPQIFLLIHRHCEATPL